MKNGEIKISETHPTLYRILMVLSVVSIALAVNFLAGLGGVLRPTFSIWSFPNTVWAAIFLISSANSIVALNFYRRLRWVRRTMAFSAAYMLFLTVGTSVPGWEGNASFQLPIVYAGIALIQLVLLWEPFINPKTAAKS